MPTDANGKPFWEDMQEYMRRGSYYDAASGQPGARMPLPGEEYGGISVGGYDKTNPMHQARALSNQYENQLRAAQYAESQELARLAREQSAATLAGHQQRMQQGQGDIAGAGALVGGPMGLRAAQMGSGDLRAQGGIDLMQLQAIDEQERLRRKAEAMRRRGEYGVSNLDMGGQLYAAGQTQSASDFAYQQAADRAEEAETLDAFGTTANVASGGLASASGVYNG